MSVKFFFLGIRTEGNFLGRETWKGCGSEATWTGRPQGFQGQGFGEATGTY